MYGETVRPDATPPKTAGLSPRVRGNLRDIAFIQLVIGSIPACTGKPAHNGHSHPLSTVYPRVYGETGAQRALAPVVYGLSPRVRGNLRNTPPRPLVPRSIPACTGKPSGCATRASVIRVYPRVYGETVCPLFLSRCRMGLSPRVRGNPGNVLPGSAGHGSIPACTGKPAHHPVPRTGQRVYPRVYGETADVLSFVGHSKGLSPRVRGNQVQELRRGDYQGSIPACTGKPWRHRRRRDKRRVYPRVYGETLSSWPTPRWSWGLSPRVRGNPDIRPHTEAVAGSIPACTGKPQSRSRRRFRPWVYPRVYGETSFSVTTLPAATGLSPRVRGNQRAAVQPAQRTGSIPACTGKPAPAYPRCCPPRVYPRVYGETLEEQLALVQQQGLSPRVRGNHTPPLPPWAHPGSIPACTGKPRTRWRSCSGCWVYPRVYGETQSTMPIRLLCWGLSPRVRGNQSVSASRLTGTGSIPACTGKPHTHRSDKSPIGVYPRVYGETRQ